MPEHQPTVGTQQDVAMPESEPHHHRQYTEQRSQQEQGTESQACHREARQAGSGGGSLHGVYPSKILGQGHYKQLPPNRNRTDIKNTSFSRNRYTNHRRSEERRVGQER